MNNEMTTDNMSNEEVIEVLKGIVFNGFDRTTRKERQALHLAIKALEEQAKKGDLISREALKETIIDPLNVNDAAKNDWYEGYYTAKNEDVEIIDNAPPVEDRPQGIWVDSPDGLPKCCCNLCGAKNVTIWRSFCPNCGAKMSAEAEDAALQSKIDYLVQNMNISAARALVIIRIITGEVHI